MTNRERYQIAAGIMLVALIMGMWTKSVFYAYERGRRKERLNIILKALKDNGEISDAPLLLRPPWTPEQELRIHSKNYKRGDL